MLAHRRPRSASEIAERFPKIQRRVGGYNLDALVDHANGRINNMAHLLVGSEGTLAFTTSGRAEAVAACIGRNKAPWACATSAAFYAAAMDAAQHLVKLRPIAVELVDRHA